jgi:hypothetical protein
MLKIWLVALGISGISAQAIAADPLPPIKIYGPKVCLACIDWADHLREHGFTVSFHGTEDMTAVKRRYKVPADLESVQTAVVGSYVIEGHVPAEDIKLLLAEKPKALGLAVPGLPRGAPGRERFAPFCEQGCTILDNDGVEREVRRELFNTLLIDPKGNTSVWARH